MGLIAWMRRGWSRRRFLDQAGRDVAEQLAKSPLAEAAPAVADAIRGLHEVVTGAAHEAVVAAHESLAPVCSAAIEDARKDFQRQAHAQNDRIAQLASRCRDEVERAHESQVEQTEQLRGLRELQAANVEQMQRWAEGYDWQLIKDFCFRFIRILDTLGDRLAVLRRDGTSMHVQDVEASFHEIQFALEASGVEQFLPEPGAQFSGNEKELRVTGRVPSTNPDEHGRVANVKKPGYRLVRAEQPDRILRPALVEVFASPEATEQPQLQELQS